jgi:hypothetical protein
MAAWALGGGGDDPGSAASLATWTPVRMEARVYEEPYARI